MIRDREEPTIKTLNVVLSGSIESTVDKTPKGAFIGCMIIDQVIAEVFQNAAVSTYFYGHGWLVSTEVADLLQTVYPGILLELEKPRSFNNVFSVELKNAVDNDPRHPRVTVNALLSFAFSRSSALKILEMETARTDPKNPEDFTLLTRWDIGCRGSSIVNTPKLNFQAGDGAVSLPKYSDSSYGHADMWFFGRQNYVKQFVSLYEFYKVKIPFLYLKGQKNADTFVCSNEDSVFGVSIKKFRSLLSKVSKNRLCFAKTFSEYIYHYYDCCRKYQKIRRLKIEDINNHYLHTAFLSKKGHSLPTELIKAVGIKKRYATRSHLLKRNPISIVGRDEMELAAVGASDYFLVGREEGVTLYDFSGENINPVFSFAFLWLITSYLKTNRHVKINLKGAPAKALGKRHELLPYLFYSNCNFSASECYVQWAGANVKHTLSVSGKYEDLGESIYYISTNFV